MKIIAFNGSPRKEWNTATIQFKDYSKVVATRFNPEEKLKRRKET